MRSSLIQSRFSAMVLAVLAVASLASFTAVAHATDVDPAAIQRARTFMETKSRGDFILGYMHLGATYRGHSPQALYQTTDASGKIEPGRFAMKYRFQWNDDDHSDLLVFFDAMGRLIGVREGDSSGIINRPFVLANGAIQLLGNVVLDSRKDNMTDADRQALRKLIENADAKGLLVMALRLQQVLDQ